ncbi:MAG: ATP-dependent helicase [Thermoplasmata archaeon]
MLRPVTKESTKEEVLDLMEDLVRRWFDGKFETLTEPQAYAVPLIHAAENVIVSSPTGSGKTLTAFLSIINELYGLQKRGELEDKIYCLYISPLKALANDINRNLREPLAEMEVLAEAEGLEVPEIRVAVRSGDTSPSERQKQARRPPHIFITTPESLAIILSTPVFRRKFQDVRWVILDEIHEVCSNKRGSHLSLSLERLGGQVNAPFVRIGLSATIAPMEEVAKFLAGYEEGQLRPMHVVEVESQKRLDMRVLCPVRDMTALPFEVVNARMYDLLKGMVDDHRTTLIFTNTRSGTERVSVKLKDQGVENLEAHHGSLSKYVRLDVEERLKAGQLNAVVSSTSLELGIDIGYIDLVAQVGSPKSIAKGLQRIGRAGHAYGGTSVGRLIVFENDDLLECAALVKGAYENSIDRVDIPTNSLDVLAQTIVGMSLEQRWEIEEAYNLIRRSYCYRHLPREDFLSVLRYLSSRNPDVSVYAKIWLDEEEGRFGRKRGSRLIYFTNVGTIPEEGNYRVITHRGITIGTLSENFVERLDRGAVFVLGGRTYRFERVRGMKVYVKDASGRRPTVPSWTGEMLPRSFDLSLQVGRLRSEVLRRVDAEGEAAAMAWLVEASRVDQGSARSLVNYLLEQRAMVPHVPTDDTVVLEGFIDTLGNRNIVFHYCFGRRTNDALARAYAFAISNALGCNARISVTDDNFMVTIPKRADLEEIPGLVQSDGLEDLLRRAIRNTELFKQRFRHCATRSFMILRNYRGHEVSVGRQQIRSQRVLDWLHELPDFPVIQESYNEILNDVMDLHHAREVLRGIEEGRIQVRFTPWSHVPSPLAHNVVLAGISDIVLMEDRSAMLRDLHRKVLRRVVPEEQLQEVQFTEEHVQDYFRRKAPSVASQKDILPLLEKAGALNLVQQKGRNV